jgi:hypothetical protein
MNMSRRFDFGALVFGGVILVAGVFYFLKNTLGWDVGELNWDAIWPLLVVALGGSILFRALTGTHGNEPHA